MHEGRQQPYLRSAVLHDATKCLVLPKASSKLPLVLAPLDAPSITWLNSAMFAVHLGSPTAAVDRRANAP